MGGVAQVWMPPAPQFLSVLRAFHDGMNARVSVGGELSDLFEVLIGVKQGCVLAPVISNLFLVAVTLLFRSNIQTSDGVPFNFRLDGSLFNLRRLQAKTKTSLDNVFDLQYADDAAVPSHTPKAYSVAWLYRRMHINVLASP